MIKQISWHVTGLMGVLDYKARRRRTGQKTRSRRCVEEVHAAGLELRGRRDRQRPRGHQARPAHARSNTSPTTSQIHPHAGEVRREGHRLQLHARALTGCAPTLARVIPEDGSNSPCTYDEAELGDDGPDGDRPPHRRRLAAASRLPGWEPAQRLRPNWSTTLRTQYEECCTPDDLRANYKYFLDGM